MTTLDDFLKDKEYPNAIRMDVEGYEYQIIKGMQETLRKRLPLTLFVELHFGLLSKEEAMEILQTLKSSGFEIADATCEPWTTRLSDHRFLRKAALFLERKHRSIPRFGHLDLATEDIVQNAAILNGNWGALQICFKR